MERKAAATHVVRRRQEEFYQNKIKAGIMREEMEKVKRENAVELGRLRAAQAGVRKLESRAGERQMRAEAERRKLANSEKVKQLDIRRKLFSLREIST